MVRPSLLFSLESGFFRHAFEPPSAFHAVDEFTLSMNAAGDAATADNVARAPPEDVLQLEPASVWGTGLLLVAVGTCIGTVGKLLLRHAAVVGLWRYYAIGLLVVVLGKQWEYVAYTFCAESVVAPAAAAGIVIWNALLAPLALREELTMTRRLAVLLILLGTCGVAGFGSHTEVARTPDDYIQLFSRPTALVYYLGYAVWMLACACAIACFGGKWRALAQCALGGSLVGNAFTTKAAMELAKCGIAASGCAGATSPVHSAFFALCVSLTATTTLLAIVFLLLALRQCEALFAVTVYQGCFVLAGAISGNLVMAEAVGQSARELAAYWGGIGVVLLGLYVLTMGELRNEHEHKAGPLLLEPRRLGGGAARFG